MTEQPQTFPATSTVQIRPGPVQQNYDRAVERLTTLEFSTRLLNRDPSLFKNDADHQKRIANRLGWLDSFALMSDQLPELAEFRSRVLADGLDQVVLIGMGGSSLCPEVLGRVFGLPEDLRSYIVLDSTAPAAVRAVRDALDLSKTLFIVSSKSGGTIETRSHAEYFFSLVKEISPQPGRQFVAITDRDSSLQEWGMREDFRRVFINPSDIGGRFSALSYFGLVPSALLGINLDAFLEQVTHASAEEQEFGHGQSVGAFLFACAEAGRDKITFIASPQTAPLVPWIEQLVAESTGKEARGIIPIEGEPLGVPDNYADDRAFVLTRFGHEAPVQSAIADRLHELGFPTGEIVYPALEYLGVAFLQWEWATAAAGCLLEVNPFDEPNVTESKDITGRLLAEFEQSGKVDSWPESAQTDEFVVREKVPASGGVDVTERLRQWCSGIRPGDYVALLCYLKSDEAIEDHLSRMRDIIREQSGVVALRGWGPRFLHSIGQLYKGGPPKGHFLVFTLRDTEMINIPGKPYTFGDLISAQALGDAEALAGRERPVLQIELRAEPVESMAAFGVHLRNALGIENS